MHYPVMKWKYLFTTIYNSILVRACIPASRWAPVGILPRAQGTRAASYDLAAILVPSVVVAAVVLLIGCIACHLYRRKRRALMSDKDHDMFVNNGVPIIFADELEEKSSSPTKPLILQDEKPPMPPPGYNRVGSMPSMPHSDDRSPITRTHGF